jgi:hypothetical protein
MASFSCTCCSGDNSSKATSMTSWMSRILNQLGGSHRACQKVCWRKIRTPRQAHSKPNKASLTHELVPKRAS